MVQNQKYLGNGKHEWETSVDYSGDAGHTERLRVPGGWLYSVENGDNFCPSVVFVPIPEVVKYRV
jgi:hypothetical protein